MPHSTSNSTVPRSNYGFKVAKAGFDTRTATDYELLFNSGWPSLAIAFTKVVTTIPTGVGSILHPLGFPPLTMAWVVEGGVCTRRHFPQVSSTSLNFTDIDAVNATYYVQCYNLDISVQANYAFIPPFPAQLGTYDKNFGAKFAKPGKSVDSKNLDDYIFHTRAMSPAILSVNTTFDAISLVGGGRTITTLNPGNYVPWAFGYAQDVSSPGLWTYAQPYAQAAPRLFVDLKPNSFTLAAAGTSPASSLITLRDPLFLGNTVSVVY